MQSISNDPEQRPIDWRALQQLLKSGQYEQAAELLHAAQIASDEAGNPLVATAAAAARHICLACSQCRADIAWYRRASAETEEREDRLRQHIQSILARIAGQETPEAIETIAPDELPRAELAGSAQEQRPNRWQTMLNLIAQGRRLILFGAREPRPSAGERLEPPSLPAAQQAEPTPPIETKAMEIEAPAPSTEGEIVGAPSTGAVEPGEPGLPSLVVYCLGRFQVYQDDQPVEEWPGNKGLAVFKYLLLHREHPIAKEVLMELFWPEANPDAARNNLNVAIYGLRRGLRPGHPEFSHVLFQNDAYLLNPELHIWVDVEQFIHHVRTGQRLEQAGAVDEALREYRAAEALYQGEFLVENRYEDWVLPLRQSLQDDYLTLLDRLSDYCLAQGDYNGCIMWCQKLLAVDACREEIHRRLMRCYSRQGHYHLALRQYQLCVEALERELDVAPDAATQELYSQIRRRRPA